MELLNIKGIGSKTLEKLNSLGIYSVMDILNFLPKKYLDFTNVSKPEDILEGEYSLLKVNIIKVYPKQYSKNKVCYIKADCLCEQANISLLWFNMPFMEYSLKCGEYLVWGQVSFENNKYTLINPNISEISNKYKLKDVKPIYPLKGKLGEVSYRKIVENCLNTVISENLFSNEFDLEKIYRNIHFPKTFDEVEYGQNNLAVYELAEQLLCYKMLRKIQKTKKIICDYPRIVDNILPYKLTESQQKALCDIINDLQSGRAMNRFVLGDVGSGKTIVAHLAMYMLYQKGFQSVLLAPTEILAMQHYHSFNKVFESLNIRTALLTSSISNEQKGEILKNLENGEINMLFATHSCVQDCVRFANLKLAIIDEAHKFGVKQKADLLAKGDGVHCISMSATPLPRSFAMTAFGDLKISKLYKAQSRTSNIKTYSLRSNKIDSMFKYFANKTKGGSQIIIVCPRVVDSGLEDIYSVKSVYKTVCGKYFDQKQVGLLYGGMKNADKDKVINDFYSGNIKLLVSTTVIEVGIDIPSVDTIAVLGADRFGIATLHQLRGRVGRDGREAECYLHCASYTIPDRIKQMKEIDDGVLLSELDSQARGFGDLIGFNQSGKNSFDRYIVKITLDMIEKAKTIVEKVELNQIDKTLLKKLLNKYGYYQDIVLN